MQYRYPAIERGVSPSVPEAPLPHSPEPRVWVLLGRKAGDNTQVLALAARLGWPFQEKNLVHRPWELVANRFLGVTLLGIDRKRSSPLRAPWPDLVISSGRRNEPVARWIQRQSGGVSRLVHVGRPWADPGCFDLVIATPQYPIGTFPNVHMNALPMHRLDEALLRTARERWAPVLAHLPSPRIAVLLGGNSGACVFTQAKARRLGSLVNGMARSLGGSVLVTDSARTPEGGFDAFTAELDVPLHAHRWGGARENNPYLGFLAIADRFVVTADSVSMVAEAEFTGRPVHLFSLEDGAGWWKRGYNYRFDALIHRLAVTLGPVRMRRDAEAMMRSLVGEGRAVWLGEAEQQRIPGEERPDDTLAAALAVSALFTPQR